MNSIEEVREFFRNDRFAYESGAYIEEIGDHYAKCSMEITEKHLNAMGSLMGGATFTLADFAFAVAANWQNPGTVSINSNIALLGTPKGKKLIAEAVLVKNGRSTCCYRIDVTDELGAIIAAVMITGFNKR